MLLHHSHISKPRIRSYIFGFNGQLKDNEVYGEGNSYTAEFWQYDPRIGRRWNLDPMTANYPGQSPYAAFNNCPLYFKDPAGLEGQGGTDPGKKLDKSTRKSVSSSLSKMVGSEPGKGNSPTKALGSGTHAPISKDLTGSPSTAADATIKDQSAIAAADVKGDAMDVVQPSQASIEEYEDAKREAVNYVQMHQEFGDIYEWKTEDEFRKDRINDIGLALTFGRAGILANPAAATEEASIVGQNFGKLGTVVNNPNLKITGISQHGMNQAITRQVTSTNIINTVRTPAVVLNQGGTYLFISKNAGVVLNTQGKLVSTYPSSMFDQGILNILNIIK